LKIRFLPLIVLAGLGMAGAIGGYALNCTGSMPLHILITLESSSPIETQLYYDTGKGFNESESLKQVVYQANVPVTLDFDIPDRKLNGLRFDPGRSHTKIKIFEILIQNNRKGTPFAVPLDSLTAARDINSLQYDGKAIIVETTGTAQDPILHLSWIGPVPQPSLFRALLHVAAGAAIALGMAFFILWVYRNSSNPKEFST